MAEPLESLTLRLSFDDKLSAELRAAAAVLTAQGRGMAQAIQPVQEALVRLDKDGRASLERLAVGAQESAAQVAKSAAGIDKALDGIGNGGAGGLGPALAEGARGASLLDASALRLSSTLTGLAGGILSVGKAVQFAGEAFSEARRFQDEFARIPLDLDLSAEAAQRFSAALKDLAAQRNLPVLEVLQAARKAVQEGAGSEAEVLQVLGASLDLVQSRLATVPESISLLTARLGALQEGEDAAGREAATLSVLLEKSGTSAQVLEAGLARVLPKARDIGASARDIDTLFLALRNGGRTAEASFAAIEGFLNDAFSDEGQAKFREFGLNFTRAEIAARGLIPLLQEAADRFGDNERALAGLTSKGGGLSRILLTFADGTKAIAESVRELDGAQKSLEERAAKGAAAIDAIFNRFSSRYSQAKIEFGEAIDQILSKELARFEIALGTINIAGSKLPGFATEEQRKEQSQEETLRALVAQGDEAARLTLELRNATAQADDLQKTVSRLEEARGRVALFSPVIPGIGTGLDAFEELKRRAAEAQARVDSLGASLAALKPPEAPIEVRFTPLFDFQSSALSDEVVKFQAAASKALASVSLPPLEVGVTVGLPENLEKAAAGLRALLEKSTLSKADLEAAKEYFAAIESGTEAQSQAEQLLAQLRARSLDGLQRQTAESQILLAGIEKQIAALQEEGVAVDALRAAFRDLGAAEAKRLQDAAAAQAKQIADQRAALGEKLNALGSSTATGLDAQFRAVEDRIRSFTREVDRARETASAAGQKGLIDEGQLASATAALDELAAGAIRVQSALKAAESEKFGQEFAKSLQEIDAAIAGLGRGLQSGLDAEFAQIDAETRAVLDRIQKARDEADAARDALSRSGLPTDLIPDTSALDAAAAKALLLGDALKFSAQTEQAREFQSVLADIGRDVQQAAAAGLPEVTREFAQAAIDLRAAQADAQRRIEDAVARGLVDPADAKRLVENRLSAIQREFDAKAGELTLEFVLRPSLQIEEERLRRELEAKLRPFALKIEAATAERDASLNPETGQYDPDKVRAVEEALNAARLAAEAFNKELFEGAGALGEGFSAGLSDRIKAATNDFVTGAKLASTAFDALGGSLGDAFYSIVEGSKSASEAFKDFVRSFVAQIAQAISQALAFRLVAGSIGFLGFGGPATLGGLPNGGVGFAAEGGVFPGQMLEPFRFAEGGIMPGSMQAAQSILHEGRRLPVMNYAVGGVARTPQAAIFAEKPGMAEAFVPLPGPDRGIPVEFRNLPDRGRREPVEPAGPTTVAVSVNYQISALDAAGVREMLVREARTIEDVIASAVSSGTNRGLTESVRSAGNPARG